MSVFLSDEEAAHVNRICRYLALDDFGHRGLRADEIQARIAGAQFDVVAVFGNQVLATIEQASFLYTEGLAARILFSGGVGHSTPLLFKNIQNSRRYCHLVRSGAITPEMAEADMMSAMASFGCGVSPSSILVENRSVNTGENARFSWTLLRARMPAVSNILIMQDPVMQRRTVLTMMHNLCGVEQPPSLFSHAVFLPEVAPRGIVLPLGSPEPAPWESTRFLSLVLGEVERLRNDERGYGPRGRGFIPAEDVPAEVLASYESLKARVAVR